MRTSATAFLLALPFVFAFELGEARADIVAPKQEVVCPEGAAATEVDPGRKICIPKWCDPGVACAAEACVERSLCIAKTNRAGTSEVLEHASPVPSIGCPEVAPRVTRKVCLAAAVPATAPAASPPAVAKPKAGCGCDTSARTGATPIVFGVALLLAAMLRARRSK